MAIFKLIFSRLRRGSRAIQLNQDRRVQRMQWDVRRQKVATEKSVWAEQLPATPANPQLREHDSRDPDHALLCQCYGKSDRAVDHQRRPTPRSYHISCGDHAVRKTAGVGQVISLHSMTLSLACCCSAVGAVGDCGRQPWLPPAPPLPPLPSHPPLASRRDPGLTSLDRYVPPLMPASSHPCTADNSAVHCNQMSTAEPSESMFDYRQQSVMLLPSFAGASVASSHCVGLLAASRTA